MVYPKLKISQLSLRSIVLISAAGIGLTPAFCQSCSTTGPPLNGKSWATQGSKSLYIDPNLPAAMQTQIKQAATNFAAQTDEAITILPAGSADPGTSTQNAIRFLNTPAPGQTAFAHTDGADIHTSQGADTNQQVSSTTTFDTAAMLVPASGSAPAILDYDPNQPNASQFVYDATLHELGHTFGLDDEPVPTDPTTGQPNYALQAAGASIMNGFMNTNDQGPHGSENAPQPGGIGATGVQPCDKQQINSINPPPPPPPPSGGGPSKGSGGGPVPVDNGGGNGDSGGGSCGGYQEWDDQTNTLTWYYGC